MNCASWRTVGGKWPKRAFLDSHFAVVVNFLWVCTNGSTKAMTAGRVRV